MAVCSREGELQTGKALSPYSFDPCSCVVKPFLDHNEYFNFFSSSRSLVYLGT